MDSFNEIFSSVEEAPHLDEFQVDDLLNLGELPEPEKEKEEDEDVPKGVVFLAFDKKESLNLLGISIPEEADAADLEWLSRFVHDCHSEQQPAVVSMAIPAIKNEVFIPVKAKRSKRKHRISKFWLASNSSPVSSISSQSPSSSCSSSSFLSQESYQKKRGRKPRRGAAGGFSGERQCAHCGVQKTPQWRAGPHGPKTLCNACGVRFKSGRLLPEYRPACSPTFMSNVHSNKHQAVLELRRKKERADFWAVSAPVQRC